MRVTNPALVSQLQELGVRNVGDMPSLTPNHFYIYTAEFTTIAAGATGTATAKIDAGAAFIVDDIIPTFQLNGAFGAAIDGSPLSPVGNSLIANNTMPTLEHVRLQISTTDRPWQNSATGVRASAYGNAVTRAYLSFKISVAGNDIITVLATNDGPTAIKGQVNFVGHRMPPQG